MSFLVMHAKEKGPSSVVVICRAAAIDGVKRLAEFPVAGPLSKTGFEPATHHAFHIWADEKQLDRLMRSRLIISVSDGQPRAHLLTVIKSHGLRLITRRAQKEGAAS
jgi:hypothetical protein